LGWFVAVGLAVIVRVEGQADNVESTNLDCLKSVVPTPSPSATPTLRPTLTPLPSPSLTSRQLPSDKVKIDCSNKDHTDAEIVCKDDGSCGQFWDFSDTVLNDVELTNCCIELSSFVGSSAEGARFGRTNNEELQIQFRDCDMRDMDWGGIALYANFTGNVQNANLDDVPAARLANVTLSGADMTGSHIQRMIQFEDCNFTGIRAEHGMLIHGNITENIEGDNAPPRMPMNRVSFREANMRKAEFKWINGEENKFRGADLEEAIFEFVTLDSTEMSMANFEKASFGDSRLTFASMAEASFVGAQIRNLVIQDSDAVDSDFTDATSFNCPDSVSSGCPHILADRVDFQGSKFDGSSMFKSEFISSNLEQTSWVGANCRRCVFSRADVSGADFSEARLFGSDFSEAKNVDLAKFEDAEIGNTTGIYEDGMCEDFCDSRGCSCVRPTFAPTTDDPDTPECVVNCNNVECFPEAAEVVLADGSPRRMADLQVGDVIHTGRELSPVYFFSHRLRHGSFTFLEFGLSDGSHLTMSPGHYLYRADGSLASASSVQLGDVLAGAAEPLTVQERAIVRERGLYAPHTYNGDLVVNGVQVSSYTTTVAPRLAHTLLAPLRFASRMGLEIPALLDATAPRWITGAVPLGGSVQK